MTTENFRKGLEKSHESPLKFKTNFKKLKKKPKITNKCTNLNLKFSQVC